MGIKEDQKVQQKQQWDASAASWERHAAWLERAFGPITDKLLAAVAIRPGESVLDLASGSGEPAISEAKLGATVLATDLSREMVGVIKRRAATAGVTLEARVLDMERMDLPSASYDVVTCRFGLMFCPDPEMAASEVHRVLKPGGRYGIVVWGDPAKNPFFTSIGQIVNKFTNAPPPDPKAPGVFRLAAPGELERVLGSAGFSNVSVEAIDLTFSYDSPQHYWDVQSELAAMLKAAVAKLPADEAANLKQAVLDMAQGFIVDGRVQFAAQPLLASGTR